MENLVQGVAPLKLEFLIQNHVRQLELNFVAEKDKGKMFPQTAGSSGPPRKKLKGQNKFRPRHKQIDKSEKLCFKLGSDGFCPFGDTCCYSHDLKAYLEKKPPDIDTACYLFRTFGKCPYSFSCRFGSDHIKDEVNVVDESKYKDEKQFLNALNKDVQKQLWRHTYNFDKSDAVLAERKQKSLEMTCGCENHSNNLASGSQSKCLENTKFSNTNNITDCQSGVKAGDISDIGSIPTSIPESIVKSEISNINNSVDCQLEVKNKALDTKAIDCTPIADCSMLIPERKKIDFKNKLYLAPLTTVGNMPFRRICKEFGADITCSEMAVALSLLQGSQSEWALIRRHHTEDIFGVQLCGSQPDVMTRCCQVLSENTAFDFIDLNMGCPLDGIYKKGAGCGLMNRTRKMVHVLNGMSSVLDCPITLKMRTGMNSHENIAHKVIDKVKECGAPISLITLHGRSREQRYTKLADWEYINACNKIAAPIPLFGNGDILSYEEYNAHRDQSGVSGIMLARGALMKPWIFKEIKEQKHWDISSSERFDILKSYTNYGLENWGSDTEGVEKTRRFLLEWLSFLYRYIPVGLLERLPQKINERPPPYFGRNDLETLFASPSCGDWIKISEMLLGPVPDNFIFLPKHKANAYK